MGLFTLEGILKLVGKLDDNDAPDPGRERFRNFLRENVQSIGQVRDYIQTCLSNNGDQYNKALQDLVNHLGTFLGFKIVYGRYRGVSNQVGFDGHWISPKGLHIVVEVKTTETYSVGVSTVVGYVDALISAKEIPSWNEALGLYVIGKPDETRQIRNAIIGEKREHQLRLVSVDALLSLAELVSDYDVTHEDVLAILRPSGPSIDPIANLLARLVAVSRTEDSLLSPKVEPKVIAEVGTSRRVENEDDNQTAPAYWLTPVGGSDDQSPEAIIQHLVGKNKIYGFAERTPGRRHIKPGDRIAFYASGNGVVAHAEVESSPEKRRHPAIHSPDKYEWVFRLRAPVLYLEEPQVIDATCRSQLDSFENRDPNRSWAWFVQSTRRITAHDFELLTVRR